MVLSLILHAEVENTGVPDADSEETFSLVESYR